MNIFGIDQDVAIRELYLRLKEVSWRDSLRGKAYLRCGTDAQSSTTCSASELKRATGTVGLKSRQWAHVRTKRSARLVAESS